MEARDEYAVGGWASDMLRAGTPLINKFCLRKESIAMPLISVIGIIVVTMVILIGAAGCSRKSAPAKQSQPQVTAGAIRSMSQADIEKMLRKLETKTSPKAKMGAMCYSMAAPPDRAEYVCPTCGEKTLYTTDQARAVAWDLQSCRREFESIMKSTKLLLSLSESSYCKHCQPDAEKQELTLTITYEGGRVHSITPVTEYDLRLLRDFLKGKLSYETFNEGSHPLKDSSTRLRELLGMKKPDSSERK